MDEVVGGQKSLRTTALYPVKKDWVEQGQYTQYSAIKWQIQHLLCVIIFSWNRAIEHFFNALAVYHLKSLSCSFCTWLGLRLMKFNEATLVGWKPIKESLNLICSTWGWRNMIMIEVKWTRQATTNKTFDLHGWDACWRSGFIDWCWEIITMPCLVLSSMRLKEKL